ncbi:MAG: N-acyl-D-aspartate/D-glutamate deacylase [Porticoccus sp.]|jgi:N-acyl-D-aspartate/D-glutamate deacylase
MKKSAIAFSSLYVSILLMAGCASHPKVDVLILSGLVFDGTDKPATKMDIGICGEQICALSAAGTQRYQADNTIDATGLVVSPGFIDPHTHSIDELKSSTKNQNLNYLFQGVSTVISGNDGGGPVDIKQAVASLNPQGIGTNTAFYVGHGTLREQVMGTAKRYSSLAELAQMKTLLNTAMSEGALGLSSGLYYVPGSFAATEEVLELAKVAASFKGVYDTHLRDESTFNIGFLPALDEAIDIARRADIHLHVAHIKALGVDVWGQSEPAIAKINKAKSQGVSISADQYPWQASGTNVRSALVPKWAMADSQSAFFQRLDNPELIEKIESEIGENIRRRGGPESLLITASQDSELVGKTLAVLADQFTLSDVKTVIYLVKNGRTRVASFNMHEDDIKNFMQQPWVVTSSDGTNGHPRKYASFPQKYQQYVLGSATIDIARFIRSSSGQTAEILGLGDRGFIKPGFKADVLVFEPKEYKAQATFKAWDRLSTGVRYLLINGELAIDKGQYTGVLAGQFVARKRN